MRRLGYLLVAAGSSAWATNGIVSSLLFSGHAISPTDLAAVRIYGGAALLGVGAIGAIRKLPRRSLVRLAAFGLFGISLPQWLYYMAISRINVPVALVIIYTAPALVAAYERVAHGVRVPARVLVAIVVAISGVAAAVLGASGGVGSIDPVGLLCAVGAMIAYCSQIVLAASLPTGLTPFQRIGGALLFALIAWMVLVPVWSLPFHAAGNAASLGPRTAATLPMGSLVAYVIVVGTVIPYALLVAGASRIGAGASAVTGMVEPVLVSVLAWVVLGQSLTVVQIAGIAVALGAVTAAEVLRARGRAREGQVEPVFAA